MDKEDMKKIEGEMMKGFAQSIYVGAQKTIEISAKYVLADTLDNNAFKKGAVERLTRLIGYCAVNEQPLSSSVLIRILRESETDKDLMNALQYDFSDEFERSVNEVLYACLNYFSEMGESMTEEIGQEVINNAVD